MKRLLSFFLLVSIFLSGSLVYSASPTLNEGDFQIALHEEEPDPFD